MSTRQRRVTIVALSTLAILATAIPAAVPTSARELHRSQMVVECQNVYRFIPTRVTWAEARDAARSMGPGAHLATISSWEENVCVRQAIAMLMSACMLAVRQGGGCPPEVVWIGGSDARAEGIWRWLGTSGTGGGVFYSEHRNVAAYTAWNEDEPNDFGEGEDCLLMRTDDSEWNDGTCDSTTGFVVEFERRTPRRGALPA